MKFTAATILILISAVLGESNYDNYDDDLDADKLLQENGDGYNEASNLEYFSIDESEEEENNVDAKLLLLRNNYFKSNVVDEFDDVDFEEEEGDYLEEKEESEEFKIPLLRSKITAKDLNVPGFEDFSGTIGGITDNASGAFGGITDVIGSASGLIDNASGAIGGITFPPEATDVIGDIASGISGTTDTITGTIGDITDNASGLIENVSGAIENASGTIDGITDEFDGVTGALPPATTGINVPSPPTITGGNVPSPANGGISVDIENDAVSCATEHLSLSTCFSKNVGECTTCETEKPKLDLNQVRKGNLMEQICRELEEELKYCGCDACETEKAAFLKCQCSASGAFGGITGALPPATTGDNAPSPPTIMGGNVPSPANGGISVDIENDTSGSPFIQAWTGLAMTLIASFMI